MRYAGIDLHKKSLTVCVIDKSNGETLTRRFACDEEKKILQFFKDLGCFEAVVEASATYEWLWLLLEPIAQRLVLAHPKNLRIIADSMKKTDRRDAYFLAWLLSQDAVPEAHRPSPRQREYQQLVRHRQFVVQQRSTLKTKVRAILANRNLDLSGLFSVKGAKYLAKVKLELPEVERFCIDQLLTLLDELAGKLKVIEKTLVAFRRSAPKEESTDHGIIRSVPGFGHNSADVTISHLGDVRRFPNLKKCTAYAGIVPGFRESDKKRRELSITKEGPRILRWTLVEAAWRAVRLSGHWRQVYQRLAKRRGKKIAIVAVARRLLGVIYTLLKQGKRYVEEYVPPSPPRINGVTGKMAVTAKT